MCIRRFAIIFVIGTMFMTAAAVNANAVEYKILSDKGAVGFSLFSDFEEYVYSEAMTSQDITPEARNFLLNTGGIYIPASMNKKNIVGIYILDDRIEIQLVSESEHDKVCIYNYFSCEAAEKDHSDIRETVESVSEYHGRKIYYNEGDISYETTSGYFFHRVFLSEEKTIVKAAAWNSNDSSGTHSFSLYTEEHAKTDLLALTDLKLLKFNSGIVKRGDEIWYMKGNTVHNGWYKFGKYFYYFENDRAAVGEKKIGGKLFDFDKNGHFIALHKGESADDNVLIRKKDGLYCAESGNVRNGWYMIGGNIYYFENDRAADKEKKICGIWYDFDDNGHYKGLYSGWIDYKTVLDDGSVFRGTFITDGEYIINGQYFVDGWWYGFDENGFCVAPYNFPRIYDENDEPYTGIKKETYKDENGIMRIEVNDD